MTSLGASFGGKRPLLRPHVTGSLRAYSKACAKAAAPSPHEVSAKLQIYSPSTLCLSHQVDSGTRTSLLLSQPSGCWHAAGAVAQALSGMCRRLPWVHARSGRSGMPAPAACRQLRVAGGGSGRSRLVRRAARGGLRRLAACRLDRRGGVPLPPRLLPARCSRHPLTVVTWNGGTRSLSSLHRCSRSCVLARR